MKITKVISHILMIPDVHTGDADSAQDNLVVEIHTDERVVGIGESDTNPWGAKALIDCPSTHNMGMGLKDLLIGEDPLNIEALWDRMCVRRVSARRSYPTPSCAKSWFRKNSEWRTESYLRPRSRVLALN